MPGGCRGHGYLQANNTFTSQRQPAMTNLHFCVSLHWNQERHRMPLPRVGPSCTGKQRSTQRCKKGAGAGEAAPRSATAGSGAGGGTKGGCCTTMFNPAAVTGL